LGRDSGTEWCSSKLGPIRNPTSRLGRAVPAENEMHPGRSLPPERFVRHRLQPGPCSFPVRCVDDVARQRALSAAVNRRKHSGQSGGSGRHESYKSPCPGRGGSHKPKQILMLFSQSSGKTGRPGMPGHWVKVMVSAYRRYQPEPFATHPLTRPPPQRLWVPSHSGPFRLESRFGHQTQQRPPASCRT